MWRACFLPLALVACTQIPDLDQASGVDPDAPYPDLIPLDAVLTDAPPRLEDDSAERLAQRTAALQARAARLRRGEVLDDDERRRLSRGAQP